MTLARPTASGLALACASLLALVGCTADPTTEAPEGGTGGLADQACQDLAAGSAQAQGDRVFVEAGGASYIVDGVRPLPDSRVIVATTVDRPELVGYAQVHFLSQCTGGELVLLGGYVPIDGDVQLLFTTDDGDAAGGLTMELP
jgi:hypothetical protein